MQRFGGSRSTNKSTRLGHRLLNLKEDDKYRENANKISWWWPIIAIMVGIALFQVVYYVDHRLPNARPIIDIVNKPYLFSGERSKMISERLQALGPKLVGDDVNEISTPQIIEDEVKAHINNSHPVHIISVERQRGSGAYLLRFKPPFINVYENVQNVIVKIDGSEGLHSVLINCHYDTAPTSYGASDDAISCAAMLEIIRAISSSPRQLKHNLVFLFNGAEESVLQASHLFLSHDWAKQCRIVVNLEAAGSGSRNILFQSGPKNSWLFKYYAKSVPYPHAQVFGEELFQNYIIPSDSDFRVFRDFGNMPGLDFAFWQNGYVYHTKYDSEKYLPIGSHQNIGENILALVKTYGNAIELNNITEHSEGQMVFYDYIGLFMISYSVDVNLILNTGAIGLGLLSIIVFIGFPWSWSIVAELGIAIMSRIIAIFASLIANGIVATIVDKTAALVMPWYSNPWLIFPMYWCPGLIAHIIVQSAIDRWRRGKRKMTTSRIVQMNLIAGQIPTMAVLFISMVIGARSGAMIFPAVFSSSVANLIIHTTSLSRSRRNWIYVYLIIHIPAFILSLYFTEMVYLFFVPIFGRMGTNNSDLTLALISAFSIFLVANFMIPLMGLVKKQHNTVMLLAINCIASTVLALTTPIGHPYNVESDDPRPQRYTIMHTYREFRDAAQNIRRNESGYLIFNHDRNSPRTLPIDQALIEPIEDECMNELFCGIPIYTTRLLTLSEKSHWIPAGKPDFPDETELKLIGGKPQCQDYICNYTFLLYGPDRKTLTFSPREGVDLISWSLPAEIESTGEWNGRPTYYIHIVSGRLKNPTNLTLSFKVTDQQITGGTALDVGLAGNHIHHDKYFTDEFRDFLRKLPNFINAVTFISAYKSYMF